LSADYHESSAGWNVGEFSSREKNHQTSLFGFVIELDSEYQLPEDIHLPVIIDDQKGDSNLRQLFVPFWTLFPLNNFMPLKAKGWGYEGYGYPLDNTPWDTVNIFPNIGFAPKRFMSFESMQGLLKLNPKTMAFIDTFEELINGDEYSAMRCHLPFPTLESI